MSTTPVLHQQADASALTADRLDDIERIAHRLARVSWIPDVYKPVSPAMAKPWLPEKSVEQAEAEIAAAGMYLASIGRDLTPMTLKLVYVVNGAVDCMYDLVSAQVHAHGHELWVEEESHESATVAGQRGDRPNPRIHRVTFTIEDAIRGGLVERWSKKDGKKVAVETYAKWTRDMLVARAGKRCAKRVAPEAMLTMPPALNYVHTDSGRVRLAEIVHDVTDDGEIVDAELVEQGEDIVIGHGTAAPPGPAADEDQQIAAAGADRENAARVGEVVGDPAAAPGPAPRWRERAVELRKSDALVLKMAQGIATEMGLTVPESLNQVAHPKLVERVAEWLG